MRFASKQRETMIWKWLKRILLGVSAAVFALVAVFAGFIIYDSVTSDSSAEFANITFTDKAGNRLIGYLAEPDTPGLHPAILLIHEWWGLNEGMTILADALAEQGYVVLAADAYRGNVTDSIPRAIWLVTTTSEAQTTSDLDAGLAFLRDLESTDPSKVATMGFCFGGGHSLQLGLRQSENLAVTIMYYGAVVTDPELLRPLTDGQPVLGIFAEEDQQIFPEDVLEFEAALNSLNVPNEITIYSGVGHGFLDEENYDQPGTPGDAWQQTLAFLEANLKSAN